MDVTAASFQAGHMDDNDALSLIEGIQAFLLKLKAEDGDHLSSENKNLLQRAAAGLGWVRSRSAPANRVLCGSPEAGLEEDRVSRDRLLALTAGEGLVRKPETQTEVERQAPTPGQISDAIRARTGEHVHIEHIAAIWTETSKEIFAVTCAPAPGWPRDVILRREPPIAVVATSLADEFDVLQLAHTSGLPVPRPLFAERDPDLLGGRVLMLERVAGRTLHLDELGQHGPAIAVDMATFLARLHALDPDQVPRFREGNRSIAEQLGAEMAKARAACERGDPSALVTAAFDWLASNFAECAIEDPAIVHGDFDLRNLLIENGRLSSVLDWELSIRGSPAQDLGYCWPHVRQISDWDRFMAAYVAAGGRCIPLKRVLFFAIWSQLWRIAVIVPLWRGFFEGSHPMLLLGSLRYLEQQVYLRDLDRAFSLATSLPQGRQ